jgi:hypothetical protein
VKRLERRAQLLSRDVTNLARAQHAVEIVLDPDEPGLTREETHVLVYRLLELEASNAAVARLVDIIQIDLESAETIEVKPNRFTPWAVLQQAIPTEVGEEFSYTNVKGGISHWQVVGVGPASMNGVEAEEGAILAIRKDLEAEHVLEAQERRRSELRDAVSVLEGTARISALVHNAELIS